jgi:HAD superfamily hydrolase (TIGR01509 family)
MSTKLIIFDCDGVLVDSEIISSRIEAAELTRLGYSINQEENIRRFTGKTQKDILEIVEEELGRKLPDGFQNILYKKIYDALTSDLVAIEGVELVLSRITSKCIASNGEISKISNSLKVTGLDSFFPIKHRFSAEMVAKSKPSPDLFLFAADKMGYPPASCIVIEDSITGVQGAKAAGMTVLGFTGASHITDKSHSDSLISAGATETFSKMTELLDIIERI